MEYRELKKLLLLDQAGTYWRYSLKPMTRSKQLQSYVVLDVEPVGPTDKKFAIADVQVFLHLCRASRS